MIPLESSSYSIIKYIIDQVSLRYYSISPDGTSNFKFDLKVMDTNNEANEIQLASIGDRLKFVLNLENAPNQVKTSPQNCYATKPDGSGKYSLIKNR